MRATKVAAFAAVILTICSPALTAARADLTGSWILEYTPLDVSNSTPEYVRVTLKQSGSALTGTMGNTPLAGSVTARDRFELRYTPEKRPERVWHGVLKRGELIGEMPGDRGSMATRAYRDLSLESEPRTHVFEPKEFHLLFSGSIPPALHVFPGDTVKTVTIDAAGNDAHGVRRSQGGNPQTGPFYIEGALPGDTLAVHLLAVRLNRDTAVTTATLVPNSLDPRYFASLGEMKNDLVPWRLDRERGVGMPANPSARMHSYTVPLRPMLGCIGVAPPERTSVRTRRLGAFGGNLDYNRIVEGTTVYLPVFQLGALLFIGDGHAAQGDGELAGNALETSLDVEFRIELIRGRSAGMPRAESADARMAMGIGGSLHEALQQATTNMARWLQQDYRLDRSDLSAVFGTAMSYDVAEVVSGEYHVVARLSKQTLEGIAR